MNPGVCTQWHRAETTELSPLESLAGLALASWAQNDLPTAQSAVEKLLTVLAAQAPDNYLDMWFIYQAAQQVLQALHDARAAWVQAQAEKWRAEWAAQIEDGGLRAAFLAARGKELR